MQNFSNVEWDTILHGIFSINNNKYKDTCGSDYNTWINSGWINSQDPYGWYEWYINFYYGRRTDDDKRQIGRWSSFKGRHSGMLKKNPNSLKTKQNLLHWGIDFNSIQFHK